MPFEHGGAEADGRGKASVQPGDDYQTCWGTSLEAPWGFDPTEPLRLIGDLAAEGVTLVNATIGNPYSNPHIGRPFEFPPNDGYESPEHPLIGVARHFQATEQAQNAHPRIPLVGTGYSWLRDYALHAAAANIEDGRATFAGIGRGSLSQPDFALKALAGQPLDRKKVCQTFSYCTSLMRSKHNELGQFPAGCPPFDKPAYGPIWEQAKKDG